MSDQPRLLRARDAVIPISKLANYALDPEHSHGSSQSPRLRLSSRNPQGRLTLPPQQLLQGVVDAPVSGTRITPFGVNYDVTVLVDGLNGATHPVATIWFVERDRPPRLISTWVDIP